MTMTPLHPGQLSVLRTHAAIAAAFLFGSVFIAGQALAVALPVPVGLLSGIVALLLGLWIAIMPGRRYRSWGYAIAEDELHVQYGVWTRTRTAVPFSRVQHIDVSQGPIERRFGVGTLVLHTAGTRSSAVHLPGLAFEDASRIRDDIRAKIREDLL